MKLILNLLSEWAFWLTVKLFILYCITLRTARQVHANITKTNYKVPWQHTINKLKQRYLVFPLNYKYLLRNDFFLASPLKYISCQNNVKLHSYKLIVFLPESRTKEMGWILLLDSTLHNNIPTATADGNYISQITHYIRASSLYSDRFCRTQPSS